MATMSKEGERTATADPKGARALMQVRGPTSASIRRQARRVPSPEEAESSDIIKLSSWLY